MSIVKKKNIGRVIDLCAVLFICILDRFTKQWAQAHRADIFPLIKNVLRFRYVENTGIAFSALGNMQVLNCILSAILLIIAVFAYFRTENRGRWIRTGLVMMVSGGAGNLYDRLTAGFVTDFIEPVFVRFAVFNVADVFVVCGAVCLLIGVMKAGDLK